jgi:hypothetical protein
MKKIIITLSLLGSFVSIDAMSAKAFKYCEAKNKWFYQGNSGRYHHCDTVYEKDTDDSAEAVEDSNGVKRGFGHPCVVHSAEKHKEEGC